MGLAACCDRGRKFLPKTVNGFDPHEIWQNHFGGKKNEVRRARYKKCVSGKKTGLTKLVTARYAKTTRKQDHFMHARTAQGQATAIRCRCPAVTTPKRDHDAVQSNALMQFLAELLGLDGVGASINLGLASFQDLW